MDASVLEILAAFFANATLLTGVWAGSLFLGALSSLTMVALVLYRINQHKHDQIRAERMKVLRKRILVFLESSSDLATLQETFRPGDMDLLREIVMGLLGAVRGDSRELLTALLWGVGVRDDALSKIQKGRALDKLRAIEVLSLFPDDETIAALHRALEDDAPNVRLMAADALAEMDPNLRLTELIKKLDIGGAVRSRMLREIFKKVGSRHIQDLVGLLKDGCDDYIAVLVLYAIGHSQDFSTVSIVMEQMDRPSVNVRAEAMRALTMIGHPAAKPAVIKALQDPAWPVRAQAAVCAGRIGFADTIYLLRALLEDDEWWARFRAAEALISLGEEGVRTLRSVSQSDGGRAAQISELVLSERGAA